MKSLSLVFPCHNEESNLERLVKDWHSEISKKIDDFEMIFVDDLSTDSSLKILSELKDKYGEIKILQNEERGRYGKTIVRGIRESVGEYVIWLDSDYSNRPSDFWKLWDHRLDYDTVWGTRLLSQRDNKIRSILTSCNVLLIIVLFQKYFKDPNCPFKLFRRDKLIEVIDSIRIHPFMTTTKIAIKSKQKSLKIKEVNVDFLKRSAGKCTVNHLKAVVQGILEMIRFRISSN